MLYYQKWTEGRKEARARKKTHATNTHMQLAVVDACLTIRGGYNLLSRSYACSRTSSNSVKCVYPPCVGCVCVIGYVRGLSSGELMEAPLPHTGAEFEYSDPKCHHLLSGMNWYDNRQQNPCSPADNKAHNSVPSTLNLHDSNDDVHLHTNHNKFACFIFFITQLSEIWFWLKENTMWIYC